jgi:hypothetical protein
LDLAATINVSQVFHQSTRDAARGRSGDRRNGEAGGCRSWSESGEAANWITYIVDTVARIISLVIVAGTNGSG